MTFHHLPPLSVSVGEVRYVDAYDAGTDVLSVAGTLPEAPENLIARYIASRLSGGGFGGRLDVVLERASVRHRMDEPEGSLQKILWIDRKDVYDFDVTLRLFQFAPSGDQVAGSVLTFERTLSVPAHWSVADREQAQAEALDALVADIDAGLRKSLRDTFGIL